jgi:hypothetical protein
MGFFESHKLAERNIAWTWYRKRHEILRLEIRKRKRRWGGGESW